MTEILFLLSGREPARSHFPGRAERACINHGPFFSGPSVLARENVSDDDDDDRDDRENDVDDDDD